MVTTVAKSGSRGEPGYVRLQYSRHLRVGGSKVLLLDSVDIAPALPVTVQEIIEAQIDGRCPRCSRRGEFNGAGWCRCGFAY